MASEPALPAPEASPAGFVSEPERRDGELQELRDSLERLRRRMQDELRLAASVQRALLPQPRDFDGWELTPEFLPFREIGGDYPLAVRADGRCDELVAGGTVLGLVEAARYESGSVALERGDLLVLYTDGVIDRVDAQGEMYGAPRLQQAAARSREDCSRIALYSLLGEVQGWSAGCPAEDDMTLLVAKRT